MTRYSYGCMLSSHTPSPCRVYSKLYKVTTLLSTRTTAANYSLGSISMTVMSGHCFSAEGISVKWLSLTVTVSDSETVQKFTGRADKSLKGPQRPPWVSAHRKDGQLSQALCHYSGWLSNQSGTSRLGLCPGSCVKPLHFFVFSWIFRFVVSIKSWPSDNKWL